MGATHLGQTQAQQAEPNTVRDRLWLFGVPADGPRLFYEGAGYRGGSRITPAEGAHWLGVPNLMFITQPWNQPPAMAREKAWKTVTTKEQYAISFQSLKRVQWAAVGSGGLGGLAEVPDIVTLAKDYPNTPEARRARGVLNSERNLSIGSLAPDFTTKDVDGVEFKLSDYRGKVVVLDFWGYW